MLICIPILLIIQALAWPTSTPHFSTQTFSVIRAFQTPADNLRRLLLPLIVALNLATSAAIMTTIETFSLTRITKHTTQPFSVVTARLYASIGTTPKFPASAASINANTTVADLTAAVNAVLGPHGFMFFAQFNHSSWLPVYQLPITANAADQGLNRGILRVILGNPLVAQTMLQYDLTAGLAIPPELLILESKDGKGTDVVYNRASDLVVGSDTEDGGFKDQNLGHAAKALDEQLEKFVEYLVL